MDSFNFVDPYLRKILGFIGVTDVTVVAASGAAQLMSGSVDRDTFLRPTLEQVRSIAA
jgi:FMN-dependent NADH-azoreductase